MLLGLAFVAWELRRREPMLDPRLFKLRGFTSGSLSIFVQFFAAFGLIFVLLQFLQLVLGYSPLEAGAALAPMALVMIVVAPRVPRLVERVGVRPWAHGAGTDGGRPPRPVHDGRRFVLLAPAGGWAGARPRHGPRGHSRDHGDRRVTAGREAGRRVGGQRRGT